MPEARSWKLETRSWMPEPRGWNWNLKYGSWKPEARSRKKESTSAPFSDQKEKIKKKRDFGILNLEH